MARISEKDRAEMKALAKSESLREDMATVSASRHNPFLVNGEVDADLVVEWLTQYNEFMGHPIKPFSPFIEKNMKL